MVPHIIEIIISSYYFQCYLKLIILWLNLMGINLIASHIGNQKDQKHWITSIHATFNQFLPSAYWIPTLTIF